MFCSSSHAKCVFLVRFPSGTERLREEALAALGLGIPMFVRGARLIPAQLDDDPEVETVLEAHHLRTASNFDESPHQLGMIS